jgi:hypothetical protein
MRFLSGFEDAMERGHFCGDKLFYSFPDSSELKAIGAL